MMKKIFYIPILFIILGLISKVTMGFVPMPASLRHSINFLKYYKKDLFEPIVLEDFRFSERKHSKTFAIHPKYLGFYTIGIRNHEIGISPNVNKDGKLKLEFLKNEDLIRTEIVDGYDISWRFEGEAEEPRHKSVYIGYFELPLSNKHLKNLKLKVTVLEPYLSKSDDHLSHKIFVGVSAKP